MLARRGPGGAGAAGDGRGTLPGLSRCELTALLPGDAGTRAGEGKKTGMKGWEWEPIPAGRESLKATGGCISEDPTGALGWLHLMALINLSLSTQLSAPPTRVPGVFGDLLGDQG